MDVRTAIGPRPGLVDPDWLEAHLHDPDVRVVEVDVSPAAHDQGHIPGAVLWNIYADLKDGDYQLRDQASIEALVRRSGIDADSTVVFYGYGPAIGLWLLRLYGHRGAYLLDTDRDHWRDAGRPWTRDAATPAPSRHRLADPDPTVRAGADQVVAAIDDPRVGVVDVRSLEEFQGERFWPSGGMEEGGRAGHVPGATRVAVDDVVDDVGAFRATDELAARWAGVDVGSGELITYCTIGARAATAWFVLTYLLDRPGCRVYDGSWAEWGRMPDLPVERSDTMSQLIRKSLDSPEETRSFADGTGHLDVIDSGSGVVGRAVFQPGWRWSSHVKPMAGTESCQAAHVGYMISGRMHVVMDDGEEADFQAGDFAIMAPGHDAWIVGDEPCVFVDWQGFADYAKA